jgi:N4-gp56 family major capsid protein
MANAYTATADVTGFIPNYYSKVFLERLQPGPKMMEFVTKKPLPLNAGKVAYFPRLAVDSTVISAYTLSEGTIRDTDKIDDAQVSCTIQQFGRSAAITDLTEMTAINGTIEEAVRGLGDQANNIIDRRIMEEAYGTSATGDVNAPAHLGLSSIAFNTVAGAEGGAMSAYGVYTGTTEFRMKASTVRNGVSWLLAKNVKPFDDGFFALVVRSNTAMRLQADSEWQTAYRHILVSLCSNALKNIYLNSGNLRKDNPDLTQKEKGNDYEQTNILESNYWNDTWRFLCNTFAPATQKLNIKNESFYETRGVLPI